tara:strand:+ start:1058 stop:1861 length:804 start_codon:yes stop_codon:yes gene_type:complete
MRKELKILESKIILLKKTGRLLAIKAEFEAEGTRIDELGLLSNSCFKNNVPLTLKTGGPAAKRDILEAFQLGAQNILVPMIESEYSLQYFINAYIKFLNDFKDLNETNKLAINIESKLGYKNIERILKIIKNKSLPISYVVIGRTDLSNSLQINNVNSSTIFKITKDILNKASSSNVRCTIGGNLTSESFEFIHNLKSYKLYAFESRKATFKFSDSISKEEFDYLIKLSLEFELAWLNLKSSMYSLRSNEETARISLIERRLKSKND